MSSTAHAAVEAAAIDAPQTRTIYVPMPRWEWDIRDSGSPEKANETTLRGHAAVFNSLSDDLGGFRELIAPGFFRSALRKRPDVRLLYNHDPNFVLARTASGTLELREDQRGLHVFAAVDKDIGWVNDLRATMQRGDVDQMSFAFTVADGGDDWAVTEDDQVVRTLLPDGAEQLFDVSVVTYPAYKATEVSMRSLLEDAIEAGRVQRPRSKPGIATGIATGIAPPGSTVEGVAAGIAAGVEDRADVPAISCLVQMYACGQEFLNMETMPDDGPDRDAMTEILSRIDQLIQAEATEPGDPMAPVMNMEMDSHLSALAELRAASKQTLRAEKEHLAHLLRKATA